MMDVSTSRHSPELDPSLRVQGIFGGFDLVADAIAQLFVRFDKL